ncbi:MAG: glycosyltransferase family 4 protein, partial [Planctomycetaceae bacterium]|nr:glycosyltransferase family 4 protein [Planctomycetaceae bacterium]
MAKRNPASTPPRPPSPDDARQPIDLAVIIPELSKYGGAERFLMECVSRWQDRHQITIYSAHFNEKLLHEHGIGKQVARARISPNFEGEHSILLNAVLLPKIWEQEIGDHDLYHTHLWPTHLIDVHPMVWCPQEPLRILHDLRYEQPLDDFADRFQRSLHIYPKYNYDRISDVTYEAYLGAMDMFDKLGKPDRIVANSRYAAGYLEGIYNTKIDDVVYPGVNTSEFIYRPSHENIFLAVGQLWPHKRVKLIIEALRYVEDSQLYIVGSGPEKEKLLRTAAGMGVADRVFFLHGLTNLEIQILFSRALAVVFVPVKEPFGIVALEAMAAGKPLIAAKEGGFTETVDENCAFLVPARPAEIAERMCYLRDHKEVAHRMGAAGLERVKAYTWDNTASQLLEIIERTHGEWQQAHRPPPAAAARGETRFGIQYYLWYGSGIGARHWNDSPVSGGVTDMPNLGYYAS